MKILNNKGPPPTLHPTQHAVNPYYIQNTVRILPKLSAKLKREEGFKQKEREEYRDYNMIKELIKSGILIPRRARG